MKSKLTTPIILLITCIIGTIVLSCTQDTNTTPKEKSASPLKEKSQPRDTVSKTGKTKEVHSQSSTNKVYCELQPKLVRLWEKDSTEMVFVLTIKELKLGVESFDKALFSPDSTKLILTFLVTEKGDTNSPPQVVVIDVKGRKVLRKYEQIFEAWISGIHPTNVGFYVFSRHAKFGAHHDEFYPYTSDTSTYTQGGLYGFDIKYSSDTSLIYYDDKSLKNAVDNTEGFSGDIKYAQENYRDTISLFNTRDGEYLWCLPVDSLFNIDIKEYAYTNAEFTSDSTLLVTAFSTDKEGKQIPHKKRYSVKTEKWETIPGESL